MNCEEYVVEKLQCIEEDNDCLKFQLDNAKRCLKVANEKLDTLRTIIAKHINHNERGVIYIDSIWDSYSEAADFNAIIEALDIPMTAEQAVKEAEKEVFKNADNINPYQE